MLMPNGNVGTPLQVFLELIRSCRLPPRIITQLQLQFPKTGSSRRYGNVPFLYEDSETVEQEEHVYTADGEEIPQGTCLEAPAASSCDEPEDEGRQEEEEPGSEDVSSIALGRGQARAGLGAQPVGCLPSKHRPLSLNPKLHKPGSVVHIGNPNPRRGGGKRFKVILSCIEFKPSLDCMRF